MRQDHVIATQARAAAEAFERAYHRPPTHAAAAPGRVNLIGEHTDYNLGYVLPMAIQRRALFVAALRTDATIRVRSAALPGEATVDLHQPIEPGPPTWANYLRGVIAQWQAGLGLRQGFDLLVDSTVPAGGGLSSSAALTVGMATLLEAITGQALEPLDKARLAQQAEHRFAGVPCGIMDPLISAAGLAGHALLIDCRSHQTTALPLPDALAVVIANSNTHHELADSAYAKRREQCASAGEKLGVASLRDASLAMLEAAGERLTDLERRRARHVITENRRVLTLAEALAKADWPTVGACMYDSHASLREDFEVTTPGLDALVDLAAAIGPGDGGGVIGARMTGGGFGGCTVTLTRAQQADAVSEQLARGYREVTGRDATIFTTRPADGARVVSLRGMHA